MNSYCALREIKRLLMLASCTSLFCAPLSWSSINSSLTGDSADFAKMTLEELGNVIVTSVSKKPERLGDAAASIFVITQDDIRRSGATSLPEALRLAPNLQVAQTSASDYAISARGFNGPSANKLLVLIDGRSVYTPLFSGVFWDVQDLMLEDVERIEVISGPGGTLWGVNAVNGVINIITKSARDTQGTLVSGGAGNLENDTTVRYGGTLGSDGAYRLYAKTFDRYHTETAGGAPVNDAWNGNQVGFRSDWGRGADQFFATGNAYRNIEGQPAPGEIEVSGVNIPQGLILAAGENLNARWNHVLETGSTMSVQAYLDRTSRNVNPTFNDTESIVDVQFLYAMALTGIHAFTWGGEYRYGLDSLVNSQYVAFLPAKLNQTWTSVFAQDSVALSSNLQLTAGARVERNDYTGGEFLPNLRLSWKLNANDMLWSALSRAVRAPSRLDHDVFIPGTAPFLLDGGSTVISEVARVLEIGYRGQFFDNLSFSATAYRSLYDHLRTAALATNGAQVVFASGMQGSTNGIEMWGTYRPMNNWRLSAGFTAMQENVNLYPNDGVQFSQINTGNDPANTWMLRSSFDLPHNVELDVNIRHIAALENPDVAAYNSVGCRIGWRPRKNIELSLTVQNLERSGHGEFSDIATRTEFGRIAFVKLVARF